MTTTDWRNRPAKDDARRYLFATTQTASRRSLWMPASQCVDIKLAFDKGILTRDSEILAVEHDPVIYRQMCRTLAALAIKMKLRHPPLMMHGRLQDVTLFAPLDFAFIDLCGTCDASILFWLERMLAPNLMKHADVAITCTYATRRSKFFQSCRDVVLKQWRELYFQYAFVHDYGLASKHAYEPIILPTFLIKCAFHNHDMLLRQPFTYRDDYPMVAIKLSDLRTPGHDRYPSFSDVHTAAFHHSETADAA